ncbi:membrane protein OxaA [Roseburia sp. CAG:303]|nr:membrane protein OxaA [Roseburia sp. CAG:303]
MSGIFLTSCTNFFLIRWIANILGFIMNLFYIVIDKFGIGKISICIIVFTIIVKLVMLPINIKQQKTMKLNSVIMPEIQAIQKKYANKKDNDSMMKQQAELNAVYQKYGTSPTGGCLPMLIQFPILLALYAVMACLPNYINEIQDMYNNGVVSYVIGTDESGKLDYHTIHELKDLAGLNDVLLDESGDENLDKLVTAYFGQKGNYEDEEIKDAVYNSFTSAYSNVFGKQDAWAIVEASFDEAIENAQDLKAISEADWKKVEDKDLAEYADYTDEDWDALISSYETILDKLDDNHKDIQVSYSFFTIDLSKSPANGVKIAIIIPILSALAQLLNMKISMSSQQNTGNGTADSMMSSMKVMSYSMCVVSAIFCYTFPAGLGLYWVISSAVQVVIQLILNKKFANMDTDQIIKQSIEKANRKRAKKGLPPNTISTAAATNTRNYKPQTTETSQNTTGTGSAGGAKKGSISEKANLNKKYMDKK